MDLLQTDREVKACRRNCTFKAFYEKRVSGSIQKSIPYCELYDRKLTVSKWPDTVKLSECRKPL